jgi:hypothetical protein
VPQLPPSSAPRSSGGLAPSAVKIWITPPDELPYSAENGPRRTSMRSAEPRLKFETWPWPSGIVAGNAVDVQAHAAHAERGARAETADRYLFVLRIVLPVARDQSGNRRQILDGLMPGVLAVGSASETASIDAAVSKAGLSERVAVTTIVGRLGSSAGVCAAATFGKSRISASGGAGAKRDFSCCLPGTDSPFGCRQGDACGRRCCNRNVRGATAD